ncbi:hypothetical protein D9613_009587 [Agrocybe pediades]|uniref:Uncharacterized protein n=1 Tax=Agrocybe pediades TaxID=84607 RepID=A0A8H4R290_9AGAR|nr:hypothetical protein D9613_009587 [Agrocybe pediades]
MMKLISTISSISDGSTRGAGNAAGKELYGLLDVYFEQAAKQLLLATPSDGIDLIKYLISSFSRYHAAAGISSRLLSYYDRWIKGEVDAGKGWFRPTKNMGLTWKELKDDKFKKSEKFQKLKRQELTQWGYEDGDSTQRVATLEEYAEAGSPVNCTVPVKSMALRRFRTELIAPLLLRVNAPNVSSAADPESHVDNMQKARGARNFIRRGQSVLFNAVGGMLRSKNLDQEEKIRLAGELVNLLKVIGFRKNYALRRKLNDYLSLHLSTTPQT